MAPLLRTGQIRLPQACPYRRRWLWRRCLLLADGIPRASLLLGRHGHCAGHLPLHGADHAHELAAHAHGGTGRGDRGSQRQGR